MPQPFPPSDAEVYARQLFEKCHGYPLWRPEPYGSSPAYLSRGINIGDVGYVTRSGGFETLFNVCLDADHPANYNGVPPSFERLVIPEARIDRAPFHHQHNSRIVNGKNVGRSIGLGAGATDPVSQLLGAGADVQYTWRTAEGAILHLPNGATRIECSPGLFHKYIKNHAHNWDTFINETLQCNLPPGSIYLVTACDKTDEWMLGSFHQQSSSREISLQISTLNLLEGRISFSYHWDRTSPLVCRDHIRRIGADAMAIDPHSQPEGGTHCVFVQGFRITIRKKKISRKRQIEVEPIEDAPLQESRKRQRGLFSSSGQERASSQNMEEEEENEGNEQSSETASSNDSIVIEDMYSSTSDWHPSIQWNERLLDMFPDADVAFTHDIDIPRLNDMSQNFERFKEGQSTERPDEAILKEGAAFWNFSRIRTSGKPPSCMECRRRKKKCHYGLPACLPCIRSGWPNECVYDTCPASQPIGPTCEGGFGACESCRKRRIRCDTNTSGCSNCARRGLDCSLRASTSSTASSASQPRNKKLTISSPAGPSTTARRNSEPSPSRTPEAGGCSWCRLHKVSCTGDGQSCRRCIQVGIPCDKSSKKAVVEDGAGKGKMSSIDATDIPGVGSSALPEENKPEVSQKPDDGKCSRCRLYQLVCEQGDRSSCKTCKIVQMPCDKPPEEGADKGISSGLDFTYPSPYDFYTFDSNDFAYNPSLNLNLGDYPPYGISGPISPPISPPTLYEPGGDLQQWKASSRNGSDASLNSIENLNEGSSTRIAMRYNPLSAPTTTNQTRATGQRVTRFALKERSESPELDVDPMADPQTNGGSRRERIRAQRIESEMRRREELRSAYLRLKDTLPPFSVKPSKPGLLARAVDYIRSATSRNTVLREQLQEQERELERLKQLNEALASSPHAQKDVPTNEESHDAGVR